MKCCIMKLLYNMFRKYCIDLRNVFMLMNELTMFYNFVIFATLLGKFYVIYERDCTLLLRYLVRNTL